MLANFHGACGGHTPALSSTEVLSQNVAAVLRSLTLRTVPMLMTPVGFEPTQLALVELESTPLDHSGKLSLRSSSIIHSCRDLSSDAAGLVVCNIKPFALLNRQDTEAFRKRN